MREVEIKAHALSPERTKELISLCCGEGEVVSKRDTYLRREDGQMMRVRDNTGSLEATVKKTRKDEKGQEDNLEYEISLGDTSSADALLFFENLGFSFYFNKYKDGWDWNYEGVHIELLKVNNLGWFLEMEALIDFDSSAEVIDERHQFLLSLLKKFGIDEDKIERRSYRSMIFERMNDGV